MEDEVKGGKDAPGSGVQDVDSSPDVPKGEPQLTSIRDSDVIKRLYEIYQTDRDVVRTAMGSFSPFSVRTDYVDFVTKYQHLAQTMYESEPAQRGAWGRAIDLRPKINQFDAELAKLRREVDEKAKSLLSEQASAKQKEDQISQLNASLDALNAKERLGHLLSRVGEPAQKRLLEDPGFRDEFAKDVPRQAYVLSIDIRRSTELMLKAREPKLFAQFIITLATKMREVILDNVGVFDKFTGDGVLAFFPDFFSGADAGYLALKAAAECHAVFTSIYRAHRHCFVAILKDTGLGIGLDYGAVQIVQIGGDFTVVGTPVVYACRMSGASAGSTFVNQPAYELLFEQYSQYCAFAETEVDIKHEGSTLAHSIHLNGKAHEVRLPKWLLGEQI